ncbi:MAG: hypothetical protein QY329_12790 [Anaerolineales bacterium]|nr:MAG: hypothetical protein QY329_12790 [Anaerolineales bacterium]
MLALRLFGWVIMFSCLLAVVNILFPKYAIIGSFLLGVFFMEREGRKHKKEWIYMLVSSFLLAILTVVMTYTLTSGICTLILMWSLPQEYCVNELYIQLAKIEGVSLLSPWLFILFMFIWYRVIFRKKYFPE